MSNNIDLTKKLLSAREIAILQSNLRAINDQSCNSTVFVPMPSNADLLSAKEIAILQSNINAVNDGIGTNRREVDPLVERYSTIGAIIFVFLYVLFGIIMINL